MLNFSVSVSALQAAFNSHAVTANNVANVSTPGYKSSRTHLQTTLNGGVETAAVRRDLSQGPLVPTGRPLDLAVSGRGYLAVDTPRGQRFTRFGQFGLDAERRLVDPSGNVLLPGLQAPPDAVAVGVREDGTVYATMADGSSSEMGRIELYDFANPEGLQAVGGGLFSPSPSSGVPAAGRAGQGAFGSLVSGFLEDSNVNLAREITDQIVNRTMTGANAAAIRHTDDMLGELLDTVR